MLTRLLPVAIAFLISASTTAAQSTPDFLANNTVLIVRHAEKPLKGRELTPQGEARARAYVQYFQHFHNHDESFGIDGLYAGADSEESMRPRLTLEPLHASTGMELHSTIGTKESPRLVAELRTTQHGKYPLISWRHGQIPSLLEAFGASPAQLLPEAKWPDEVFDWVVVLHFDKTGKLDSQELIHENLTIAPQ
ncbi:hypothetical protein [Terriglobus roseus]|uniref:Uncharacterized protein n=1 Tax=Terriglobus roseus TaxID=392734 RepID=A0A1G7GRQ6_9BACT|nr:hypothetical protein [Terriglobus roseus]SDE90786.1 hypothetical protein SAMN05444167_0779 [Terriglobus roseus]